MGVLVKIDGKIVQGSTYRITESSMPLAGGDSSGAVGTISLNMREQDGSPLMLEKSIEFVDTNRGSTVGTVREVQEARAAEMPWNITADTRLGDFNIEVQAQPFSGRLEAGFRYYCALANIDSGIIVDPLIADRPVNFIGWNGNLWAHMKMMATGLGADLNVVSNNVVLRPVRLFTALSNREVDAQVSYTGKQLALKQEVVWYGTEHKPNGLIYPPGGWTREVRILSVNAGETVETVVDTDSSITSIQQPVCLAVVPPEHASSSVYTVVGDDNIVIQPAQWAAYGGSLSVTISEDTRQLIVKIVGASGIYQINGNPMKTYRIALTAGTSDSTYSTLRIVGDSVALNKASITIPTGVEPWRTGQEFAPTIDNPFLNNLDDAYSAGTRGASRHSGKVVTMSANVTAVNRRGERGTANYPPYSQVQAMWDAETYGSVKAINAGKTYGDMKEELYESVQDDFDNQVFGNVNGARMHDYKSGRWYRVRDATTEWGQMSVECDSDITFGDVKDGFIGMSYGQVKTHFSGKTYFEANLVGLK